jgi:hypothetical protein
MQSSMKKFGKHKERERESRICFFDYKLSSLKKILA